MSLLQMSVAGAVMILVITVIRALTINRVPKRTFLVLWGIALVRLLIPYSFPSWFSIYSLLERETPAAVKNTPAADFLPVISQGAAVMGAQQTSVPSVTISVWNIVWVTGVILCAVFFISAYLRCYKEFQTSLPIKNEFIEQWLQSHPLKRRISIRQADFISSPLTFCIWQPVILMPKKTDWENEIALRYVLEHEFVHIRRFDTVTKLLLIAAVCVHWFNPMVWVMYILANRDIELSCDETVVHQFGNHTRAAYAKILISMEETNSGFAPLCNHFSKNAIEERITAIMKTKKTTIFSLVLACLIIAGTAIAFATSAQAGAVGSNVSQDNQSENEILTETETCDNIVISYLDDNGQVTYLIDDGNTTTTLTEEEFEQQYQVPDIEWWTYEEYKDWLENEKVQLQSMIGEKAWTGGRGEFVWTQEIVDETIAMYEGILEDIKNGMKYSKTVDGETDTMVSYDPGVTSITSGYQLFVKLDNGDEKFFGPYETANELLEVLKPFCEEQVKLGNMQQSEADEIISRYTAE